MKLLALDTATEQCSVALQIEDRMWLREQAPGPGHSANILGLVQALLREAAIGLGELNGIAFGRGPGGFTGVRLAASITQGLAFGAGLKVLPVSDLLAVAQRALDLAPGAASVLVCNDARMQEVYWTCASRGPDGLAVPAGPERVGAPDTVQIPAGLPGPILGAGRGFTVWSQLKLRLGPRLIGLEPELLPHAREILALALPQWQAGHGLAPEQALPVYLRNDVAKPSRK